MKEKKKKGLKIKPNGKILAEKCIHGKRYYKEFTKESDALRWQKNFHPMVHTKNKFSTTLRTGLNGRNKEITLKEVLAMYEVEHLDAMAAVTYLKKRKRMSIFLAELMDYRMCEIEPSVISAHIDLKKLSNESRQRCNFDKDLKDLASVMNWYRENKDFTFNNPVQKIHRRKGKIKDTEDKEKYMNLDELQSFFNSFEDEMFQDLAVIQFFLAARIQEAAALTVRSIDLKARTIKINQKIVWIGTTATLERGTKTGELGSATIPMNDEMFRRIQRRILNLPKGCELLFHNKGKLLTRSLIATRYEQALKLAGLDNRFSGTHFLRFSMAKISRQIGGLDASQAILRHTTARMSEHYARLDESEKVSEVVIKAEEMFRRNREANATKCDRPKKEASK